VSAYYNEFDPYAAEWLRSLIMFGLIAPGDVDERSIVEVKADDLRGYKQCHFFAGIGGWSVALRLAGWPGEREAWTGSCPCQPFSLAGKQKGKSDERHLWPEWFRLIREIRPAVIFGEQVAAAIAHEWWDDAADDMEGEGYETGAAVLPACSVGAPHRRERLWFVADAEHDGRAAGAQPGGDGGATSKEPARQDGTEQPAGVDSPGALANAYGEGLQGRNGEELPQRAGQQPAGESSASLANAAGGSEQQGGAWGGEWRFQKEILRTGEHPYHWHAEPAVGRVADGIYARSHKLRGYGNAIVPQVAAEFIKTFAEYRRLP
jgi:DNA (cytosine-5)-methyltransferase 1